MAEMNEQHFETIDENKDRLYQKKKEQEKYLINYLPNILKENY